MSQEVILGEETNLTYILQNRVSFDLDDDKDVAEFDRAEEEYDFKPDCRNPNECKSKCRCFVGKKMKLSIAKVKDQTLAWKIINYLVEHGCIQNASHWRTEWKRVNAPELMRQSSGGGGGSGSGKITKKMMEEEQRKLLLNPDYRREKMKARKKELKENLQKLEKDMEKANRDWEEMQKKLQDWNLELQQYEGEDEYVPQEHQAGGGVDQGELSDEPEPYPEEEEQQEPPPPPPEVQKEQLLPPPQEKKKKGRPKKVQGEVVGEMVERLESQNEQV